MRSEVNLELPSFFTVIKNVTYTWKNHFVVQLATLSVLSATFTVILSLLSLSLNLNRILVSWGESVKITAYLKDDLKPDAISKIESALRQFGEIRDVQFVTKERAQKTFSEQMARYSPDLLEDPEFSNPFPANFQISLSDRLAFLHIDEIAKKVSAISGVEDVSYGQDWVGNYSSLVSAFSRSTWFIAFVLLIGSAFVVGNSIRTSVSFRKDEIELLDLVGATQEMIWIPFVIDGILMGLAANCVALLVGYGIYEWGVNLFNSNLAFLALSSQFYYFDFIWVISSLALGAVVGGLSSYVCVQRVGGFHQRRRAS